MCVTGIVREKSLLAPCEAKIGNCEVSEFKSRLTHELYSVRRAFLSQLSSEIQGNYHCSILCVVERTTKTLYEKHLEIEWLSNSELGT